MAAIETKEAILNSLLGNAHEFQVINSSFSSQIHALFEALYDFEELSETKDETKDETDEGYRYIREEAFVPIIRIRIQSFDRYPNCLHRNFHSRRLFLRDLGTLLQLWRVSELRLFPAPDYGADIDFENAWPVSLRSPLELVSKLPTLRSLDCPWLWERMPVAFRLRTFRHFTRPWEGP
ncbi:hypothetical protein K445DRAFT_23907 [Daldinia sp. EC12]|nr:hypothetical protein K445DRAFT_23907 [Daldinia sp. EC12]